jgi:hypothetical protein
VKCPDCGTEDPNEFVYCTGCRRPRTWASAAQAAVDNGAGVKVPASGPSGEAPNPSFRLLCLEGDLKGQEFPLTGRDISIGRQADCDLVLPDQQVSRHHTRIRFVLGRYQIEDTGSTHGTWVNEARLTGPRFLSDRDIIRIGAVKLGFRPAAQVPAARVPAMPALMTIVEDVGHEPPAFDTPRPVRGPEPPPPRTPPSQPRKSVREELVDFERSLTPFVQRLEALSASVKALTGEEPADERSATPKRPVLPDAWRGLAAELEAEGGAERYGRLQRLLAELQSAPSDLRLLLRVSDELPAIIHLVEVYLRALDLWHELERT